MAVRPYLSRSEVWLASGNFRVAFKFPIDFHPSAFIKWYPGHMAKGLFTEYGKCDAKDDVLNNLNVKQIWMYQKKF